MTLHLPPHLSLPMSRRRQRRLTGILSTITTRPDVLTPGITIATDTTEVDAARAALGAVTSALKLRFFERDSIIDGLAIALVAGEHMFLLGDPGTAKSELVETTAAAVDAAFFANLCNRYQQPDEVVGHWDVGALQKENRYLRRTTRRLPEARVAFLDEVFKGSPALLNTLLKLLNERTFENDGVTTKVPLRLVVGASNETPDPRDGLDAFYDRFLLRYDAKRLTGLPGLSAVLFGEGPTPPPVPSISFTAIDALAASARTIAITGDGKAAVLKIRDGLEVEGIKVSDRRWKKIIKALKASAAIRGVDRVTSASLSLIEDAAWSKPEQRPKVQEIVRSHVASWVRDLAKADSSIDEQMARASNAKGAAGKRSDSIAALGRCLDVAIETAKTVKTIGEQYSEAADEVTRVNARLAKLQTAITEGMRAQGVGAQIGGGA